MRHLRRNGLSFLAFLGVVAFSLGAYANGTPPPEEKPKLLPEITGTVDVTYNYNFNRPPKADTNGNGAGDTAANPLRAFDTDPNSFSLNLVELGISGNPVEWLTYRFDLDAGRDTRIFQAFGFNDGDNFELQQGYLYLTAPIGNGLSFKVGKYVTLHGAEVIESAANNNTSRSLLFTWAIPFTHTGVLMDYTFNDYWGVTFGVVNGWDNVLDNNNGKTFHSNIAINPVPDKLSLWVGGTFGPEQDNSDGNLRFLVDAGLIWKAREDLSFTLNYDLGKEEGIGGTGFPNWWGVAAYAHWRATDLFGLTFRGEYFDEDLAGGVGVRTASVADKTWETTLTSHFYLTEGLDLRGEWRTDKADGTAFAKHDGTATNWQHTVLTELVYAF